MQGTVFDEAAMFRTIEEHGIRALLVGRRALVALGLPVLTADYDFWVHTEDIAAFNAALEPSLRRKDVDDIELLEKLKLGERGEPT